MSCCQHRVSSELSKGKVPTRKREHNYLQNNFRIFLSGSEDVTLHLVLVSSCELMNRRETV